MVRISGAADRINVLLDSSSRRTRLATEIAIFADKSCIGRVCVNHACEPFYRDLSVVGVSWSQVDFFARVRETSTRRLNRMIA